MKYYQYLVKAFCIYKCEKIFETFHKQTLRKKDPKFCKRFF